MLNCCTDDCKDGWNIPRKASRETPLIFTKIKISVLDESLIIDGEHKYRTMNYHIGTVLVASRFDQFLS